MEKTPNRKIRVYIAHPYTIGDVGSNVRNSMTLADTIIDAGLAVFNPLLSHFQHILHPRQYAEWLEIDKQWLYACDCVFRAGGESSGADGEVELAMEIGIPVFTQLNELLTWVREVSEDGHK